MPTIHPFTRRSIQRIATALTLALPVSAAFAQPADRGQQMRAELKKRFDAADVNHDGQLTKDEARAGMPMVYAHFDEIDVAHRGAITLTDIAAFVRARRAAKGN